MKELLTVCAGICIVAGVVILIIRATLYYWLDAINDYGGWPGYRRSVESILHYDKKVKPGDEGLKKITNLILEVGWSAIGIGIIIHVVAALLPKW